jgi:outer membrane protein OmpU
MKNILLTTTALTMLAGAAAAELSVGGDGRMGVSSTGGTTSIDYRYRVKFNASGETDGGLTFGANAGLRWDDAGALTAAWGPSLHMGNGTMTLRVGNTAGGIEAASGIWGSTNVGYSGMSFGGVLFMTNTSSTTTGAGANQVAVDFALGSANVTVSGGNGNDTEVGVNFAAGAANVGIGYDAGAGATGGVYVTAGFDAGSANINVAYVSPSTGTASWSLGASMGVGAGTMKAYVANKAGASNYGLGYSQSLGGGATLGLGFENMGGTTTAEAGVSFGF